MRVSDFYNDKVIIEGFGKGRTFDVIRNLRAIWKDFPTRNEELTRYNAAWLIWILGNCKSSNKKDVVAAITRGGELKSNDEYFVIWLGDVLCNTQEIQRIRNIFIFYDQDNCTQITYTDGRVKVFQGENKVASIRRAAILNQEFLLDVGSVIQRSDIDHCPNYSFGPNNEIYLEGNDVDPFGYLNSKNEVLDTSGNVLGILENDELKVFKIQLI